MITTSAKWKQYTLNNNVFHIRGTLTDRAGRSLSLSDSDFMMGTVKILDATSDKNTFGVGCVITNTFNGTLNNIEEKFESFNLDNAVLNVEFGAVFEDATEEWIPRGSYTVEKPRSFGNTISIVGYDYMDKLNKYYIGKDRYGADIVFPISAEDLAKKLCDYCEVPYDSNMWQLGAFSVQKFDYNESTTCRQVLGWILQCVGGYARMSNTGKLVCKWYDTKFWTDYGEYDGGLLSPWNTVGTFDGGTMWVAVPTYNGGEFLEGEVVWEFNRVTRTDVSVEEIQITGVRAYVNGTVNEFQFETVGNGGYVLALQDNPLITSDNALAVATAVYNQVKDLKFHIFDASVWGSPDMEAGDGCIVQDYKGRKYVSIITNLDYTLSGLSNISLGAETPGENSMETANPKTSTIAGAIMAAYDYVLAKKLTADVIEGGILKSNDSNENFYLNMVTGELRMNATSLSINATAIDDYIEEVAEEVSDDALATFISGQYSSDLLNLQDQIDKNITTWFYAYEPTLSNFPASDWTTIELKNEHIGDLFYDTDTGYVYRFMLVSGVYSWSELHDSDIAEALSVAQEAEQIAEGKTTIWYGTTSDTFTGVQNGDYLVDSTTGATYRRVSGAWTKVTDYETAISTYDSTWTQTKTFNRLTNNGALQGLYMSSGNLYVNATYIKSGILTGGTEGQSGYYYLGVAGKKNTTIGGTVRNNLKLIVGTDFGVDENGTLYANNAVINGNGTFSGTVNASSGSFTGSLVSNNGFVVKNGSTTLATFGAITNGAELDFLSGFFKINATTSDIYRTANIEMSDNSYSYNTALNIAVRSSSSYKSRVSLDTSVAYTAQLISEDPSSNKAYISVSNGNSATINAEEIYLIGDAYLNSKALHTYTTEQKTITISSVDPTVSAGHRSGSISVTKDGYTPIGVLGYTTASPDGATRGTSCNISSLRISGTDLQWQIRNVGTSVNSYVISVTVLYEAS